MNDFRIVNKVYMSIYEQRLALIDINMVSLWKRI